MALTGLRDLMDTMGMPFDEQAQRQKVVDWLNNRQLPFIGIGQNRAGNVRGILVNTDVLLDYMRQQHARKAEAREARAKAKKTKGEGDQQALPEAVGLQPPSQVRAAKDHRNRLQRERRAKAKGGA